MKSTRKFYWIFIFLCGLSLTKVYASAGKGDSLFFRGEFRDAALEYDRQFFMASDAFTGAKALLGKAECYKQMENFVAAKTCLTSITLSNIPDSLLAQIRYQLALNSYLAGDFGMAESEIILLEVIESPEIPASKILLLKSLTYNELNKYKQAHDAVLEYISNASVSEISRDSLRREVETLYRSKRLPHLKSPKRATILSIFLPGLGQTYAGYPGEGIISLSLNVAALGILVFGAVNAYYISGYVVGAGFLQNFYNGGQKRAAILANKHNYRVTREFNDSIHHFLMSIR